jgi:hypothetical protein
MPAKKFKNQAEDLLVEAVELLQQNSGEETAVTATATNNLGMFYKLNDQPEKALPLYEKSYEIRREVLGDTHPDTIAVMHNLVKRGNVGEILYSCSSVSLYGYCSC